MDAHEIVAEVLHDHGRLSYQDAEVEDWRDCGRAEVHDDVARRVLAFLAAFGFRVVPADLVDGMRGIASARCLGDRVPPGCSGTCVTCQARAHVAHLDGDDPLAVFAGNP